MVVWARMRGYSHLNGRKGIWAILNEMDSPRGGIARKRDSENWASREIGDVTSGD